MTCILIVLYGKYIYFFPLGENYSYQNKYKGFLFLFLSKESLVYLANSVDIPYIYLCVFTKFQQSAFLHYMVLSVNSNDTKTPQDSLVFL